VDVVDDLLVLERDRAAGGVVGRDLSGCQIVGVDGDLVDRARPVFGAVASPADVEGVAGAEEHRRAHWLRRSRRRWPRR